MKISKDQIQFYDENGYVEVVDLINPETLSVYQKVYNNFLNGEIDTGNNRTDLGDNISSKQSHESITQIMWPSDFVMGMLDMTYHKSAHDVAKCLLGDDMEMDFDMLINKAPNTNTPTPWHQDAAYWEKLPDKRAVSCWMALDDSTVDNGCMWYVPKSHKGELRPHKFASKEGGALMCEGSEKEGIPIELSPGSCVLHDGRMLHYSRGNSTNTQRRAFIINFRPKAMIDLERKLGFDHGRTGNSGNRKIRSK